MSDVQLAALEARLTALEDKDAIRRLVHDYGVALDNADFTALEDLFDAEVTMLSPDGLATGREAVIGVFRRRLAAYTMTYHFAHTHGIDLVDADRATGVVAGGAQLAIDGRSYVVALRYHDDYQRGSDGRWRFRNRRQEVFYVLPIDELPDGIGASHPVRWPGAEPRVTDVRRGPV